MPVGKLDSLVSENGFGLSEGQAAFKNIQNRLTGLDISYCIGDNESRKIIHDRNQVTLLRSNIEIHNVHLPQFIRQ